MLTIIEIIDIINNNNINIQNNMFYYFYYSNMFYYHIALLNLIDLLRFDSLIIRMRVVLMR